MTSKLIRYIAFILLCLGLFSADAFAENEGGRKGTQSLNKTQGSPTRTYLNINKISTQIYNDGNSDIDPSGNSGLIYPKGSGKGAVFESGLLWGARIEGDPQVRVGGSSYRQGLQPGKILPNGTAEDPDLAKNRIYRVRPDVYPGGPDVDLSAAAADEGMAAADIRAQYELDWTEWPVADGAPYEDVDENGSYDPNVDIPGVPGADQTIWFVANDLDKGKTNFLYGANPLGIEMQATIWAYSQEGALGSMLFRKYKLINKSDQDFLDMYLSMWSDVDLGNSVDDFAGCDTTLSLGYCYNANANDATYSPLPPPAVGFDFFQGPVLDGKMGEDINENGIDDAQDYAIFDGKTVGPGKINLPMTSFYYFARGDASVVDPTLGDPQGSTQFYNFFQGKIGLTGEYFVNPNTGKPTTFALPGDPVSRQGWIDGQQLPGGDRRIGMASGPFTMAVGDTQEVVVAEIVAGAIPGVDRLAAIGLLKFYDKQAQLAYDNFFDLPVPPPAPQVKVIELDEEIVLSWGDDHERVNATESSNNKGFEFQGYNVYQLPNAAASVSEGVRIATYDIKDGIGKIKDLYFDATTGVVNEGVIQFGNDTGIKRFLKVTTDALNSNTPLVNGKRYYFAVTSYSYNDEFGVSPNNLENPLAIITVVPQSTDPGVRVERTGEELESEHVGTADGGPTITIVDPTALTGHEYEVYFSQQAYSRGSDGVWTKVNAQGPSRPKDLTGSTLVPVAEWGEPGTINLHFVLDLVSPDYDYSDGVQLTFPAGVSINATNAVHDVPGKIDGQVVTWGSPDTSTAGHFSGGESFSVNVNKTDFSTGSPLAVDYIIWDDGWATDYGNPYDTLGNGIVHAEGTAQFTSVVADVKTERQWNLKDLNTGEVKLENMTIIGGYDIYGQEVIGRDITYAPTDLGTDAAPIVDGFQISVSVNYDAPIDFSNLTVNGDGTYDIDSYAANGWSATAKSSDPDVFGAGTDDINILQQDYELRFTGEYEAPDANGVVYVKDGTGSLATLYGARGYDLADHPMNPNPGSNEPFLIRIPFEVWNVDTDQQINLMVYDRIQAPGDNPFYAFNPADRMYCDILNTPYEENVQDPDGPAMNNLTWNLVFWTTDFVKGDVIEVQYDNPIQFDTDKFTFKTPAPTYDETLAKEDVGMVNVFPNPYYAVNPEELNKYNRFVTFSHLPRKATIRIFNLAGVLVKTIEKDNSDQFERWDLANMSGLPVASGLYVAYIDMPELGETKILKVAIIQEEQILDRF